MARSRSGVAEILMMEQRKETGTPGGLNPVIGSDRVRAPVADAAPKDSGGGATFVRPWL